MSKQYLHLFQNENEQINYVRSNYYEPYLGGIETTRKAFYNNLYNIIIDDDSTEYKLKYWWSGEDAPISNLWYDRINNKAWNTTYCTYDATNKWYDMSGATSYCYMNNNSNKLLQFGAQFKIFVRTMFKHNPKKLYGNYFGDFGSLRGGSININLGNTHGTESSANNDGLGIGINCKSANNNSSNPAWGPSVSVLQNNFKTWTDFRYLEYEIGYKKLSSTQARCYSIYNNQVANGTIHTPLNWNNIGTGNYFTLGMGCISSIGSSPGGNGLNSKAFIKMMEIKIYVSDT